MRSVYYSKNSERPEKIHFTPIPWSDGRLHVVGSLNIPSTFYYDTSSDNHRLTLVPVKAPPELLRYDKYRVSVSTSARSLTMYYLISGLSYDKDMWRDMPEGLPAGTKFTLLQFTEYPDVRNFEYPNRIDGWYSASGLPEFNRSLDRFNVNLPVYMFLSCDIYSEGGIIADIPIPLWIGLMVVFSSSETSGFKLDYCIYKVKNGVERPGGEL